MRLLITSATTAQYKNNGNDLREGLNKNIYEIFGTFQLSNKIINYIPKIQKSSNGPSPIKHKINQ